jgi:hypothetical protein
VAKIIIAIHDTKYHHGIPVIPVEITTEQCSGVNSLVRNVAVSFVCACVEKSSNMTLLEIKPHKFSAAAFADLATST